MASWKRIYTEKEKDTTVMDGSSNLATTSAINTALNSKSNSVHTHTSDDVEQMNTSGFNINLYELTDYMINKNDFAIPGGEEAEFDFSSILLNDGDYVSFKITANGYGFVLTEYNHAQFDFTNGVPTIKSEKINGTLQTTIYDANGGVVNTEINSAFIKIFCSTGALTGWFSNERYVFKGVFVDLIYPIGSIYFTLNDDDPNLTFVGTEWERIKDKFLLASDNTYTNDSTGGSANAVNVSHTHIQNAHTHTQNGHTHAVPSSRYVTLIGSSGPNWGYHGATGMKYSSGNYYYIYSNANASGIGEGGPNIGNATAVNQSTIAENNSAGDGDGTGKNMPPFVIVNCWERVK